jgi:aspartyl-tRNA(Asn)/glutamyl-tRNA(Gln) amidotransferase subunit C
MSLDAAAVAKIARLARIRLTEEEQSHLAGELNRVLGWVDELQSVNTTGVEPMTSVVGARLRTRPDVVDHATTPDDILTNAPEAANGFFVVPKVVE